MSVFVLDNKTTYSQNKLGEYTHMSLLAQDIIGLTEPFHSSLKIRNSDLPAFTHVVKEIEKEHHLSKVKASQLPNNAITALSRVWIKHKKEWVLLASASVTQSTGEVQGNTRVLPASLLFSGWYECLDFENKVLKDPIYGEEVPARDMQILRMLLMGFSRKDMAIKLHLSVKSIEKMLTKMRAFPYIPKDKTMEQQMAETGLAAFLLGNPDWFATKSHFSSV